MLLPQDLTKIAEQLFSENKYQDVIAILDDEILLEYNNKELYAWKAVSYFELGEAESNSIYYQKAIEDYNKSIQLDKEYAYAYSGRGNAWAALKEYDKAIEDYNTAIELGHADSNTFARRGLAWYFLKEYDKAVEDYEMAIDLDFNNPEPYNNRGLLWHAEKEYDRALKDYTMAILVDGECIVAYTNRGDLWYEQKEYKKAIEDYSKAVLLDKNCVKAYNNRGNIWAELKDYHKAIEDYNKAIELEPDLIDGYNNRGNVLSTLKQYDKALENYNEVIRLDENKADAYYNIGVIWYRKKEYHKAIENYTKAIQSDRKYTKAYNNRGLAWYDLKKYDRSIDDYTRVIELNPGYADTYNNLGLIYSAKKEYDKALENYNKAIESENKHLNAYYNRALIYVELGKYTEAINDYKRFIEFLDGPKDYYAIVAQVSIKELEKMLADKDYCEISELVMKIQKLLLYEEDYLTHYTSLSSAELMLLKSSLFRLSEGSFLNDTSEGRELFKYLSFSTVKKEEDETIASLFVEKPFIGSFVVGKQHDNLMLWRLYGREAAELGKGCALTIERQKFLDILKEKIDLLNNERNEISNDIEQFAFFRVAYRNKQNVNSFFIPGNSDKDQSGLNMLMFKLKVKLEKLPIEKKEDIAELLNNIAYLFKSSAYQEECEVRLVVQGVGFEKIIDTSCLSPKVYIELIELTPVLYKVTLGPKVEKAEEWAAAFNYHIKKRGYKADIVISHLPFK